MKDFYKAIKSGVTARDYEKKLSDNLSGKELIRSPSKVFNIPTTEKPTMIIKKI